MSEAEKVRDMEEARVLLSNAISWMHCTDYEGAWKRVKAAVELFEKHGMKKESKS
jgi:hypothetical protein